MSAFTRELSKGLRKIFLPKETPLTPGQERAKKGTLSQVASKNFGKVKERIGEYKGAGKAAGAVAVVEGGRRLLGSGSPASSNADRNSDNRINTADFPTYRRGTKSAKAFQKAFTEAAQQGDKTFRFQGIVYDTEKLLKELDIKMPKSKPPPPNQPVKNVVDAAARRRMLQRKNKKAQGGMQVKNNTARPSAANGGLLFGLKK